MNIRIFGSVTATASVVTLEVTALCVVPKRLCLTLGTQAAFLLFISDQPSRD